MMKDSNAEAMRLEGSPVPIWEDKFKKDSLNGRVFREYWRLHVPRIFAPVESTNFLHMTYDADEAQRLFFDTLCQFIYIGNPVEVLKQLKELTTPAALCGKVFHMGEATYSCRDCGQDNTCVLCRECFKQSDHQQHRYKMNQSVGGGYCDCGDLEAWKDSPSCRIHQQNAETAGASSLDKFPQEVVHRARAVFRAVLEYAMDVLTHENTMALPHDLRAPAPADELRLESSDCDDVLLPAAEPCTPLFVTVFYNDETHTFEQVIECLRRAIECSQRDAVDYATIIDRVGRSIVICGDFQTCSRVKQVFELHSSRHSAHQYKVHVMRTDVVAHQTFALRLLLWLKKLLEEVAGFRQLFSQIVTQPATDGPLLERVMKSDTQLWKQARNEWHLLLIQGMLMDLESKKTFAKTFTRLYPTLMREFMCDDHNHSDSVTSLSVQIYTVPTVAYLLIADEDCLAVVTRTFYAECINRRKKGVLNFDARNANVAWRRINYCLHDLRYLLSVRPPQWTDQLRRGFLHGFTYMLDVLALMEGMDASTRQTGSHLEYDPEWQTAFTLLGKLSLALCLLVDWCSSDRLVLIKAYRAVLRQLHGQLSAEMAAPSGQLMVGSRPRAVIAFDMWQNAVSLHAPLTRMLAGLHLHLGRFGLHFNSSEFDMENKPTVQQIMETSMRAVILTTQVRAGMWRRNGNSLHSQVHFYSNVRIRSEMQDRDVQILQMAAALQDPDEYVGTLMQRYGVLQWMDDDFEQLLRRWTDADGELVEGGRQPAQSVQEYTHNLEDLLLVLVHVFSERYQPGVGQVTSEQCLKKEIIQALCMEPTPHSKLCKLVAESQNVSIEQLAGEVASFKQPPHGTGKGVYELKPEFEAEYNPFWYHYTREEQSRAEGAQRRRRRGPGQPDCLPPPPLPPFTAEFRPATRLANCDTTLRLLRTVLHRSADLQARVFSETLFQRALFMIGLAVNEERREATAPPPPPALPFTFAHAAQQAGLLDALQAMLGSGRVSSHADLLSWVLSRLTEQLGGSAGPPPPAAAAGSSSGDGGASERERRRAAAAARRARILGQMQAQQKRFVTQNQTALSQEQPEPPPPPSEEAGTSMELAEAAAEVPAGGAPVCLGPRQTPRPPPPPQFTCILCQASEQVGAGRPAMVMAAFVQLSTVLSRDRTAATDGRTAPLYMPANLHRLPHTSSCGHAMHAACWQRHFENVCLRERRRTLRMRHNLSYDVSKREFLCPLCQCLSNTVMPLVPARRVAPPPAAGRRPPADNLDVFVHGLQLACHPPAQQADADRPAAAAAAGAADTPQPWPLKSVLKSLTQREAEQLSDQVQLGDQIADIPTATREMMNTFAMAACLTALDAGGGDGRARAVQFGDGRVLLSALQTCAYTLHSTEQQLRLWRRPLLAELGSRADICLTQLTQVCASLVPVVADLETARAQAAQLLRHLLVAPDPQQPCLLEMDAFGLLVTGCALLTTVFSEHAEQVRAPAGSLQDLQMARLALLVHLVQILLTADVAALQQPMETEPAPAETEPQRREQLWLAELYTLVRSAADAPVLDVQPAALRRHVAAAATPFLRCCALYFHYVTGVPAPAALRQSTPPELQTEPLLRYLGLDALVIPHVTEPNAHLQHCLFRWCRHPAVGPYLAGARGAVVRYPLAVNTLVPLPLDFSELINKVSDFTCPSSAGESRVPAMCLVCGRLLCSQSYCCQQPAAGLGQIGACNAHLVSCGAGVGLMLRIRECRVHLLVNKVRGATVSPPYVDKFGEMDQGLQRGNPLALWRQQYDKLTRLWISHSIPEEVTRHMEDSLSQTDWHNL